MASTFASRLRKPLDRIRSLPGRLGLRPYTVELIVGTWSGAHTGDGTETTTTVALTCNGQPPKVHWLDDEELALGQLHRGHCDIGPVTPVYVGGGVDPLDFGALLAKGETLHLKLTGPSHPNGALYRVAHAHQEKALNFVIRAKPVAELSEE
jgi:hypothetical protein